jgi:hypothetical protein
MAKLCEVFPDHPLWMQWYSGVAMYADLHKKIIGNTAPYKLLPAGIYMNDEYKIAKRIEPERMHQQLLAGQKIGDNHVVRAIPALDGHFGNLHLILAQAIGMSTSAQLRGDLESSQLAERQLEWTLGLNPFSRSLMYGEGYDYLPLYSPMNGDIVGALPTGMPTFKNVDEPYWTVGGNEPAPKEVWVQTEQLFINLAGKMLGPSILTGQAKAPVLIRDLNNGSTVKVSPDGTGEFKTTLPQGSYQVVFDGLEHNLDILPGGTYHLNNDLSFTAFATPDSGGKIKIDLAVSGKGTHTFDIRLSNITIKDGRKSVDLKSGKTKLLSWTGTIDSENSPWYAVVIPDGNVNQRQEVQLFKPLNSSK